MFFSRLEKVIFFLLCALIFVLPASTAGVEIFSYLVIFALLLKKTGALVMAFRNEGGDACRERCAKAIHVSAFVRPVYMALLTFVICSFISVLTSQDSALSLKAFLGKILPAVLVFMAAQEVIITEGRARLFIRVFLISAFILCLDGLWQLWSGYDVFKHYAANGAQIRASFRHQNGLGAYLIPAMVLGVSTILSAAVIGRDSARRLFSKGEFWISLIFLVVVMIVLGLTFSRGAWLGMGAGLICLMFLNRTVSRPVILITGIFLLLFIPFLVQSRNYCFFPQGGKGPASVNFITNDTGRWTFWRDGFRMFKEHPIFGSGLNTYTVEIKKSVPEWQNYPHNCFLQMAAETGIVGLAAFLFFIGSVAAYVLRWMKDLDVEYFGISAALFAGWVGLLVQSGFDTTLYSKQLNIYFWILTSLCVAYPLAVRPNDGVGRG